VTAPGHMQPTPESPPASGAGGSVPSDNGELWEDLPPVLAEVLEGALPLRPGRSIGWGGVEALGWWERKQPLPANLVTTGLPTDARPGALGQRNTLVVPGAADMDFGIFAGLRLFGGAWVDPHGILGLDASGFVLEQRSDKFGVSSTPDGNPLLGLRHLDPGRPREDAFVISAPLAPGTTAGPVSGGVTIRSDSQLWGGDANVLHAFFWSRDFRLVGLAGFRYLELDENLAILTQRAARGSSMVTFLGKSFAAPASEQTDDEFHGRNEFFGGQLGLRGEYFCDHFFLVASTKLALGETYEVLDVVGISTLAPPPVAVSMPRQPPVLPGGIPATPRPHLRRVTPQTVAGGLYALGTNSGHFANPAFGVAPEGQLQAGVLLTRWMRVTAGCDVLYWSRVFRPGDQVDLTVNRQQVPTDPKYKADTAATSPRPLANPSAFWAEGVTLGLEFNF
jgi:hypothetical protein